MSAEVTTVRTLANLLTDDQLGVLIGHVKCSIDDPIETDNVGDLGIAAMAAAIIRLADQIEHTDGEAILIPIDKSDAWRFLDNPFDDTASMAIARAIQEAISLAANKRARWRSAKQPTTEVASGGGS